MLDIFKQSSNISSDEFDDLVVAFGTGLYVLKMCPVLGEQLLVMSG